MAFALAFRPQGQSGRGEAAQPYHFRLPDKALDLVDQACAAVRFRTLSPQEMKNSGGETPPERPGARRASHSPPERTGARRASHVGRDEIAAAVAGRCGIPVGTLTADEGARLMALEAELGRRVKGQPEAIAAVAEAVRLARAGLKRPGRPVGVFLFVGPSGTGKTELAKALAEVLFHDEKRLIRFDMSEFMEEHSVAKLIGSPPGYVGHDEGGQLTDAIRTHPYSVVLFDEIEKAHPKVLDLFLQIFDEAMLTDSQGRKCGFRESVIILTSNLGSGRMPKRRMGFGVAEESSGQNARATVEAAIRRHLRSELVNRLTKIVHFKPLGIETAREILGKLIGELNERLAVAAVYDRRKLSGKDDAPGGKPATVADRRYSARIELDTSAEELILREGFSEEYGARNLERAVDRMLGTLIAAALLSGHLNAAQVVTVVDGRLKLDAGAGQDADH